MKILITGIAGFIGHQLAKLLVADNIEIVGLDNLNDYYDVSLKYARLRDLGLDLDENDDDMIRSTQYPNCRFIRMDITHRDRIISLFDEEQFTHVCNLAGQAGVRYSIKNPYVYIESNVLGFLNILEACHQNGVRNFVFASSSSVYGQDEHFPFSESDATDHPVSLYAATKKSDEVIAYAYSKMYGIHTTAMRFFTVYGPWGRPDMAPFKFLSSILSGKTIQVYNQGNMLRDFTYIDDVVEGVKRIIYSDDNTDEVPSRIYNIGCSQPVRLMDFIHTIESIAGKKASTEMLGMQSGDVVRTYADTTHLQKDFSYKPSVSLEVGMKRFYEWYRNYYNV